MPALIRKAEDDSKVRGPTTAFLHDQILTGSGDYPPNENVDSIGRRLARPNFVCMIDDINKTIAGFDVRDVAQEVEVMWWLPRAPKRKNNAPLLVPVFGEACEEVMRRYPGSGSWPIYGWYPGVGADFAARTVSSLEMVTFWLDYFNSTPVGVIATLALNPNNDSQYGPVSTVKQMADFARWAATQP